MFEYFGEIEMSKEYKFVDNNYKFTETCQESCVKIA